MYIILKASSYLKEQLTFIQIRSKNNLNNNKNISDFFERTIGGNNQRNILAFFSFCEIRKTHLQMLRRKSFAWPVCIHRMGPLTFNCTKVIFLLSKREQSLRAEFNTRIFQQLVIVACHPAHFYTKFLRFLITPDSYRLYYLFTRSCLYDYIRLGGNIRVNKILLLVY